MKTMKMMMTMLFTAALLTAFAQNEDATQYERVGDKVKVTFFYEDGETIREVGYYKDGVSHGKWVQYRPNGDVKIEAFYDNGQKEGTWLVWDEDGKTLYQLAYEDNSLAESHKWTIQQRDLLVDNED